MVALILILILSACSTIQKNSTKGEPLEIQKYSEANTSQTQNGCMGILENYCGELYSPSASGNLVIDRHKPIQILQGDTQNQLSQVYLKYSIAKIRNKKFLPADFLSNLERYSYFDKLDELIHRRPIQVMTLEERLESEHVSLEIGAIWRSAIEQTIVSRMSAKYRGFHQIPNRVLPIEYEVEQRRIRRSLISEFSKVLWRDNSNWKKAIEGFNDLKLSFLDLFDKIDLPDEVREDWKKRIETLELVLPGSLPEISDEECSTTTINAYYYKYLNLLTVCAGDFNSEDIVLTLAHEMSHALGLDRSFYVHLQNSILGRRLKQLRENVCSPDSNDLCSDWSAFKSELNLNISDLENYKTQLPDFNRCLKKAAVTKNFNDGDLDRIATKISKNRISNFASSDIFLRLIKNKLPMRNGKMQTNPNFMNPCSYYLWSKSQEPIDDEIYSLIFFAAEYKCGGEPEDQRLKTSIDVSQNLTVPIVKTVLKLEGEFSDNFEMTSEGYSSSPVERFADVVGTYAVAEYLQRFTSLWERRSKYLASSSWLCPEPSLESKFPEESKIVQQFNLDSHSQGESRKMEIFSAPIRDSLRCEKDFVFNECMLPFKKGFDFKDKKDPPSPAIHIGER